MKQWLVSFLLILPLFLGAQEIRWSPLPELQTLLIRNGRALSINSSLALKAALILEGIPQEAQAAYEAKTAALLEDFLDSGPAGSSTEVLGDRLLQFLHSQVLRKYVTQQTRISTALDQGTFNCVSSALLYGILGVELGLNIGYVGTKDHAFCVLRSEDRAIDVETTTPLGFDPGKKREFQDEFGRITGFSYVPPGRYGVRKTLDFPGILGLLIQNLVAERQAARDVFSPLGLAWDRHFLENTPESAEFLIQVFTNLVAHRNEKKDFRLGLEEISRMRALVGAEEKLGTLGKSMANNRLVQLFDSQAWEDAWTFLNEWKDYLGPLESQWRVNLITGEAKAVFSVLGLDGLLSWTESAPAFRLPPDRKAALEENYALQSASILMNRRQWESVEKLLEKLPDRLLSRQKFADLRKTLNYNLTVEIHNQFAALINKKDYQGARALILKALEKYPDSDLLQKDWSLVSKTP